MEQNWNWIWKLIPNYSQGVQCHAIVLCSFVNPKFKQLLLEQNEEKELFFPDIPYKYLEQFINDVYTGLCSSEFVLDINQDLAEVLGMLDGTTYKSENSTG